MLKKQFPIIILALTFLVACQKEDFNQKGTLKTNDAALDIRSGVSIDEDLLDAINVSLESEGLNYRVGIAEYYTNAEEGNEAGRTVFFRDLGNKQLAHDFVPFDARRSWSGSVGGANDNITYSVDQVDAASVNGLPGAATTAAIDRAMTTWDDRKCSDLDITKVPDFGLDLGIIAFLNGLGGSPFITADLMHAGFSDINFASGIIGATFTFLFIDGNGNFTDVNNDGKLDVAFREIYYDPSWAWAIGSNIDVETVALHEAGHGLSQGHFGTAHQSANGKVHFSPLAVMNAGYSGVQQKLKGTDNGGHCSIWGSWPQN